MSFRLTLQDVLSLVALVAFCGSLTWLAYLHGLEVVAGRLQ